MTIYLAGRPSTTYRITCWVNHVKHRLLSFIFLEDSTGRDIDELHIRQYLENGDVSNLPDWAKPTIQKDKKALQVIDVRTGRKTLIKYKSVK